MIITFININNFIIKTLVRSQMNSKGPLALYSNSIHPTSPKSRHHHHSSQQLYHEVVTQFQKNQKKYSELSKISPSFIFELYVPNLKANNQLMANHQLMDKQLQRLINDSWQLQKELNKIKFESQQKQDMMKANNIFEFLRSSWGKRVVTDDTVEKAQEINRRIGNIKGYIKKVVDKENQEGSTTKFQDIIKNAPIYLALQEENKCLKEQNDKYRQTITDKQQQIKKLTNKLEQLGQPTQINSKITQDEPTSLQNFLVDNAKHEFAQGKSVSEFEVVYQHKLNQFTLILKSKLLSANRTFQTKKNLSEIQNFLEISSSNLQLASYIDKGNERLKEQIQQMMSLGHPSSHRRFKNRRRGDIDIQVNNEQKQESKEQKSKKKETDDLTSLDGKKKRFFRSPKVDKNIRYQING